MTSVGSSHNRLTSAEDCEEALLLGCPPIGPFGQEEVYGRTAGKSKKAFISRPETPGLYGQIGYLTITKDLGRVMNRLKALYRGWAIPCAGTQVYAPHYRSEWLAKIHEAGVRRRAELYYQQLDPLRLVRQQARKELLAEARKRRATKLLRQIPGIGPLRAAHLVALMQTPHRFRTKRQLWTYSGLGVGDPRQLGVPRRGGTATTLEETRHTARSQ